MSWKSSAAEIREELKQAIPKEWILKSSDRIGIKNVTSVPRSCGLLSAEELDITERTATDLVAKLTQGELSSVCVTEAFCKRSAVAHQLARLLEFIVVLNRY